MLMGYLESIDWLADYINILAVGKSISLFTNNDYVTIRAEQRLGYKVYIVLKGDWEFRSLSVWHTARRVYRP